MKWLLIILMVCSIGLGVTVGVPPYQQKDGSVLFYYEAATPMADANTCVSVNSKGKAVNFSGRLLTVTIDSNGTDTSFIVGIYYDPPEPANVTEVAELHTLKEFTLSVTASGSTIYAIPISDDSSNPFAGVPVLGKIYIGIKNATDATLDKIKVYLYGKIE